MPNLPRINDGKSERICLAVLLAIVVILLFFLNEHSMQKIMISRPIHLPTPEFRPIKVLDRVYTFYNVCIEDLETPKLASDAGQPFNETKKIVIYGNNSYADGAKVTLEVAGSMNTRWNQWELQFKHENSSHLHKTIGSTAFFIQPTCPGNFHHFFVDEFEGVFSVVNLCNRLHPGANNQILYRTPQPEPDEHRCFCRRRYESFLRTLYINKVHDVFYNLPTNTCFKEAVFGSTSYLHRPRDVIDHVLRYHKIPLRSNTNATDLFVTIIARKDRRILNTNDVASFAREVGFKNVRIVDFNNLSISDQLLTISTSNVLIGVQGAGLQWSVFMPEGSCLIEVAWPPKHWGFYYGGFVSGYGINCLGVAVKDVRVNWTSYETNLRNGVPVSEKEKPILIKELPKNVADNIWKWSDVFIQKQEIFESLSSSFQSLKNLYVK